MTISLPVQPRSGTMVTTKDSITAVVYGPKFTNTPIVISRKDFDRTFKMAGESTMITLTGLSNTVDVLIKDVAFAPMAGGINHVDFYAPNMNEVIEAHTPIHFIGEAPAVKAGAVLNKVLHEVHLVCKPAALPSHLDVDISVLMEVGQAIHVRDIVVPTGVTITSDSEAIVVIAEGVVEEVDVPVELNMSDISVEKKGKSEEAS